jgi:hypothetical protein
LYREGSTLILPVLCESLLENTLIQSCSGDKVVFNVTPTALSWIGSGLILASAMWIAAAKDTDKPRQMPQKEWVKGDLAFGGGEGAAGLMHAEGSTAKGEDGDFYTEREELMAELGDQHHDDGRESELPEAIELKELGQDESETVMETQAKDNRKRQDLL